MIKKTPAIVSMCDARRVADHEFNVQVPTRAIPTNVAGITTNAWMLAIHYSIYHYATSIAYSNAAVIAAFTCALGPIDSGDKPEEKRCNSEESVEVPSVEDLLASDRRSIACKTLGITFGGNLTTSLRKDLIMATSVVC